MSSATTPNLALADEIEAICAIFEPETVEIVSVTPSCTTIHLQPPLQPFTFVLSFPPSYPDVPPSVDGTASTGNTARGEGEHAVSALAAILGNIYRPGEVCLFDLISDAGPVLEERYGADTAATGAEDDKNGTSTKSENEENSSYMPPAASLTRLEAPSSARNSAPQWTASAPLTVQKSTFIAHAAPCTSKAEALAHIASLVSSSKKIATATHNISAYRVKQSRSGTDASYVQDCDDDGETAAGGRLLHLLQLMECVDVVIVVTRWYGGVKLGGERFRCIGNVAREALLSGGWGKEKGKK